MSEEIKKTIEDFCEAVAASKTEVEKAELKGMLKGIAMSNIGKENNE